MLGNAQALFWMALAVLCLAVPGYLLLRRAGTVKKSEWASEFKKPIAPYTYPSVPRFDKVSEDVNPQTDSDIRIQLARQTEKVEGLEKTVEREFARMAGGLDKLGEAMNTAFQAMKNEYVNRADHNAVVDRLSRVEKVLYTLCGTVLLGVLGAVLVNVGIGK